MKIKTFTNLNVWKEGHSIVLNVYKLTKEFPTEENYILTPQILRSSISITSNIAEGFSREGKKEKIRFYYISLGSLTELQNQLLITRDVGYIKVEKFREIADKTIIVQKMLNALIKSVKRNK